MMVIVLFKIEGWIRTAAASSKYIFMSCAQKAVFMTFEDLEIQTDTQFHLFALQVEYWTGFQRTWDL
jgi:hypothetical protein